MLATRGSRAFRRRSTCPQVIDIKTLCGASLVTLPLKFGGLGVKPHVVDEELVLREVNVRKKSMSFKNEPSSKPLHDYAK